MCMQIKAFFHDKKKVSVCIQLLLFPVLMMAIGVLVPSVMNLGIYLGTFFRHVFELVC